MVKNNWTSFFGAFVVLAFLTSGNIVGCDDDSEGGNSDGVSVGVGSGDGSSTLEIANEF